MLTALDALRRGLNFLGGNVDGGTPNDARHAGYISWSPAAQALAAYRTATGLPFGLAVEAMKQGKRVARAGWNGAGMFVYLVPEDVTRLPDGELVYHRQYMALKTAQGDVAAWAPSGSDALADDWYILD